MTNTWEKFQSATLSLACSGPIKTRLNDAYRKHLADLAAEDLPEQIREDFRAFSCALHRQAPLMRGEDAIRASIRKMSDAEASEAATLVVRMFSALPRSSVARSASATVVPLFIAEAS